MLRAFYFTWYIAKVTDVNENPRKKSASSKLSQQKQVKKPKLQSSACDNEGKWLKYDFVRDGCISV